MLRRIMQKIIAKLRYFANRGAKCVQNVEWCVQNVKWCVQNVEWCVQNVKWCVQNVK